MARDAVARSLKVVDLSDSIAGQFAARLFADYGGRVLLIEPPGGSATRHRGPFRGADGASLLFEHLNGGKESATLDLADDADRQRMRRACALADVVVVSERELAHELRSGDLRALVVEVSDFGVWGPYVDWKGSELIHQALSGSMYVTGHPNTEPLFGAGERASYAAGVYAYIGALALLHQREVRGRSASSLEIAVHEAAASMEMHFTTQWDYNKTFNTRSGGGGRVKGVISCADGWFMLFSSASWNEFCKAVGATELIDDPRFSTNEARVENWEVAREELGRVFKHLRLDDVARAGIEMNVLLAPVQELSALPEDAHLRERGFWEEVASASGKSIALGPVFRTSAIQPLRNRPAPAPAPLGAEWVPAHETGRSSSSRDAPASSPRDLSGDLPLAGVRVLDLTSAWSGPMAARILGLLGADVIKLEGPARLDDWRYDRVQGWPRLYPDGIMGERPWNRVSGFNAQNHDKRSVAIDLKHPRGIETARRLAAAVDVVLANWSAGTLDRVGLGYKLIKSANPGVITVEMTAAGSWGPLKEMRGFGPNMEAMAGITSLIGYPGEPPMGSGTTYMDPMGALHGAAAVLTAVVHRDLTGQGQHVELAQQEAAMHWIGELILDAAENGTEYTATGNAVPWAAPHGAFRAAGADEWVAIAVGSDEEWRQLCKTLSASELLQDNRFATLDLRIEHRDELSAALNEWTVRHDKFVLAKLLQNAGVPAAPVHNGRDLYSDEHLRARAWFMNLDHPDAGTHQYAGLPFILNGQRLQPRSVSPPFGKDNREVLNDLLGMEPAEVLALIEDGVVADEPVSSKTRARTTAS